MNIDRGFIFVLLVASCNASAPWMSGHGTGDLRTHPAINGGQWSLTEDAINPHDPHTLLIALKHDSRQAIEDRFWAVSVPSSPLYGQYLSAEELSQFVEPQHSTRVVSEWIQSFHPTSMSLIANRDVLRVVANVATVEKMLGVSMRRFQHQDGRVLVRSLERYMLPQHIAEVVDLIKGVNDLPLVRNRITRPGQPQKAPSAPETFRGPPVGDSPGPVVTAAVSRAPDLTVTFIPRCQDGSFSKVLPPCSDSPPQLTGAVIATQPINQEGPGTLTYLPLEMLSCSVQGNVTCTGSVSNKHVGYFVPLTVGVYQSLGERASAQTNNAFPVMPTPPVTPQTLWKQYDMPPNPVIANPNLTQCVVEFEQQYYSPSDLQLFFHAMGLPDDTPVNVIGPNDAKHSGTEANLDIQYIMGMAPGVNTTFWSIKANSSVEIDDILSWAFAIGNASMPPTVNSLSYGMTAHKVNTYLGKNYLHRSDVEFMKLAMRGITIIIASGDTGAGDLGPPPMSNPTCPKLEPDWPSQSPYVTSVGSTVLTPFAEPICYRGFDCENNPVGEIGVSLDQGVLFTTGGGFSETTARPPYQAKMVQDYLAKAQSEGVLPPSNVFNASGRGYPDIGTVGHNLLVAQSGAFIPVDGTSASAPIFAGIVSQLNQVRARNSQPVLGFLNALFYEIAAKTPPAFYDVTVGNNRCGAYGWKVLCCESGFQALQGWDAVAGLGSPNFGVLAREILSHQQH